MGLETRCKAVIDGNAYEGRLHVDSKEIQFSCRESKWSHSVGTTVNAKSVDGMLVVGSGKKAARFDLGDEAERWLEKVLNPPSRMKKLGIKATQKIFLHGEFDQGFLSEIASAQAVVAKSLAVADMVLAIVVSQVELGTLAKLVKRLDVGKSIWIVWPKGVQSIKDVHVIAFCKELGMGPGKSCAFDDHLTAMRFTRK